jgi:hypothetical protein
MKKLKLIYYLKIFKETLHFILVVYISVSFSYLMYGSLVNYLMYFSDTKYELHYINDYGTPL